MNKGFVYYMTLLIEKMFPDELLKIFKITKESMTDHMAALVCPKAFQSELDKLKPQFFVRPMDKHTSRMCGINELAIQSRDLLYTYNKEKLNNFMDSIENLLIVETFLYM